MSDKKGGSGFMNLLSRYMRGTRQSEDVSDAPPSLRGGQRRRRGAFTGAGAGAGAGAGPSLASIATNSVGRTNPSSEANKNAQVQEARVDMSFEQLLQIKMAEIIARGQAGELERPFGITPRDIELYRAKTIVKVKKLATEAVEREAYQLDPEGYMETDRTPADIQQRLRQRSLAQSRLSALSFLDDIEDTPNQVVEGEDPPGDQGEGPSRAAAQPPAPPRGRSSTSRSSLNEERESM